MAAAQIRWLDVRRSISHLVILHVSICVLAAVASADTPQVSSCIFLSIIFAQSGLVGIWGGLSRIELWKRWLASATSAIGLSLILAAGISEWGEEVLFLGVVPTGIVLAVFSIVRLFARLEWLAAPSTGFSEGFQFSIYQLMARTTAIAVIFGLVRALQPYFNNLRGMTEVAILAVCYGVISIVAAWAMLGHASRLRVVIALLWSIGVGLVGSYFNDGLSDWLFWTGTTFGQACLMLLTLRGIRQLGFRLLRRGVYQ